MIRVLVWIALAGAAGTLARFGAIEAVRRVAGAGFPWGVLAVNAAGCFAYGLLAARLPPGEAQLVALTGFLGAFTTFSTYAFDVGHMIERGAWLPLGAYLAGQNVGGVALVIAGAALGKRLT